MSCLKKEKRTFIDLFKYYDCSSCNEKKEDEIIKIGFETLNIFYINSCQNFKSFQKFKLLLKDFILYDKVFIYMWLEKSELEKCFEYLPLFLSENCDLYLIIT